MASRRRRVPVVCSTALLTVAISCATSSVTPSSTAPAAPAHAAITDPVGDAVADSRIAISPDLASATVDVAGGNITFVVQFAPGTVDRSSTWLRIELDTDQNSATGNRERNGMGSDYDLLMLANGSLAAVQKYEPVACAAGGICSSDAGFVPMTFTGDTMQVTVPLSLFANNVGGHMFFLLKTWAVVGGASLIGLDSMPNDSLPPGRI